MRYWVCHHGSPLEEAETLVAAYCRVRDLFKRDYPRSMYGPNEAAAKGYTVLGKPELSPEEARELRRHLARRDDV